LDSFKKQGLRELDIIKLKDSLFSLTEATQSSSAKDLEVLFLSQKNPKNLKSSKFFFYNKSWLKP